MDVTNLRGALPERDASIDDLTEEMFVSVPIEEYLASTEIRREKQDGEYTSNSGTNIEPVPLWAITFRTSRRRIGDSYQIVPKKKNNRYQIATAPWASEVKGVGKEKEKWRGTRIEGPCSSSNLFSVVTSTYLVPFAIGHRYITHLPASVAKKGQDTTVTVHHEYADDENHELSSQDSNNLKNQNNGRFIKQWTKKAQKLWDENRTSSSTDLATEYLDYYNKLNRQPVRSYRVVYTRSRKMYAAVLDPRRDTALGLPLGAAEIKRQIDNEITEEESLNVEGIICDNLLNYIKVESELEAYWLTGLLNSTPFEEEVMEVAKGDPPNIYSIPAKLLNRWGVTFDSDEESHQEVAELAEELEESMMDTVENYVRDGKGINIEAIDDTDKSEEVPDMRITAYVNRLHEEEKLERLDEIVESIIEPHV